MKLRLPRILLLACLAALPSVANPTDLSTINWVDGPILDWSQAYVEGDLRASGEISLTKRWLSWATGEEGAATLSGTASLKAVCEAQHADDDANCTCALLNVGSRSGSEPFSGGKFSIEEGITLTNVDINVCEGAELTILGKVNSSCAVMSVWGVEGGTLDITKASFNIEAEEFHVEMGYNDAETAVRASVVKVGTLELTSNLRLCLGFGSQKVDGSLTLNQGATSAAKHSGLKFRYDKKEGGSGVWSQLSVTGALTVAAATKVEFEHAYVDDAFSGAWDYAVPDGDTVLITASDVQGDLSKLLPYASCEVYTRFEEHEAEMSLDNYRFVSRATEDGYNIYLVFSETPGDKPGDNPGDNPGELLPPISSGSVTGDLSIGGQQIDFGAADGTVDATGVAGGLNTQNVRGDSGTLVTSNTQTMALLGNSRLGYSITGATDDAAGAALLMKGQAVELAGATYHVQSVTVERGILDVGSQTTLTSEQSITVKSALNNYGAVEGDVELNDAHASLDNRGTITGDVALSTAGAVLANNGSVVGDTTAGAGSVVRGNGSFTGETQFLGATMHIGNSPGRMTYTGNTTLHNTTLEFTLDGLRASQGAADTVGTYSTVVFEQGTLDITGTLTLRLELQGGFVEQLLAGNNEDVTLNLIQMGAGSTAGDLSALADPTIETTGTYSSVLQNLQMGADGTLTATVNQALLAALLADNGGDLANTMWSSARLLEDFAAMSTSQLAVVSEGETHAWLNGTSSHMDMGGTRGFRYHGGGGTVGVAQGFGSGVSAGISLGYSEGTMKADSGKVRDEQESTALSLHGQYVRLTERAAHRFTAYVAYGFTEHEADTQVAGSCASPSWHDNAYRLGAQYGVELPVSDGLTAKPFVGMDYTRVEQGSLTEHGESVSTRYSDGSLQTLSVTLGTTLRRSIALCGKQQLLPELTIAYAGDMVHEAPEVSRSTAGYAGRCRGSEPGRHALLLRAGAYWLTDVGTAFHAFYTLETREHESSQSVHAGVHIVF